MEKTLETLAKKQESQRQLLTRHRRGQTCQSRDCSGSRKACWCLGIQRVICSSADAPLSSDAEPLNESGAVKVEGLRKFRESNKGDKQLWVTKYTATDEKIKHACDCSSCNVKTAPQRS